VWIAGASLFVAGAPASGASAPSVRATPNPVAAGRLLRLEGSAGDCPRGDTVLLLSRAFPRVHDFAGVPAVLTPVRANGGFRARPRIPSGTAPGVYAIAGRCGGGNLGFAVVLRVTEPIPVAG
jgi:hypothetical protein